MTETDELRRLNEQMFQAEARDPVAGQSWDAFLRAVLAKDFVLRRSLARAQDETRDEMIDRVRRGQPMTRTLIQDTVRIWSSATVGVVASIVTLPNKAGRRRAFQNVRVFVAGRPGAWRCVYWQVTRCRLPRGSMAPTKSE
jgi:hypothetical protein